VILILIYFLFLLLFFIFSLITLNRRIAHFFQAAFDISRVPAMPPQKRAADVPVAELESLDRQLRRLVQEDAVARASEAVQRAALEASQAAGNLARAAADLARAVEDLRRG
jgi:hypothetical protein